MKIVFELAPVIADVIAAHLPNTKAREVFMDACLSGSWEEAGAMVEECWPNRGTYAVTRNIAFANFFN